MEFTKESLWQLRQEIVLNSLFTNDFENSFGISAETCQNFFDGYVEDLEDKAEETNKEFGVYLDAFDLDSPDALWDYYHSGENLLDESICKEEYNGETVKVHVYDIDWETDGEDIDLPAEVILEIEHDQDLDIEEEIPEKLSDEYGWLVNHYSYDLEPNLTKEALGWEEAEKIVQPAQDKLDELEKSGEATPGALGELQAQVDQAEKLLAEDKAEKVNWGKFGCKETKEEESLKEEKEVKYVWKKAGDGGDDWFLVKRGEKDVDNALVTLSRMNRFFPWSVYVGGEERKDIEKDLPADNLKDIKEHILIHIDEILNGKKEVKESWDSAEVLFRDLAKDLADKVNEKFPEANITADDIEFDDSRAWSLFIRGSKLGLPVSKFGAYRNYLGGGVRGSLEHNGREKEGTIELGQAFADALAQLEDEINYEEDEEGNEIHQEPWDKATGVLSDSLEEAKNKKKEVTDLTKVKGAYAKELDKHIAEVNKAFEDSSCSVDCYKELVKKIIEPAFDTEAKKGFLLSLDKQKGKYGILKLCTDAVLKANKDTQVVGREWEKK